MSVSSIQREFCFSLGSNLGDRLAYLTTGRDSLRDMLGVAEIEQSSVYESEPVGVSAEYADITFLNAIVIARCDFDAHRCLQICMEIESRSLRDRTLGANAPRTLDIDIIYASELQMDSAELQIPHPRWKERAFVLRPLAELRPDLVLPRQTDSISKILDDCLQNARLRQLTREW